MSCELLHSAHEDERVFEMGDYQGPVARWCSGCGDHSVLTAAQKLMAEEQLKPELLEAACAESGQALRLRMHDGYDHSYFFIASFMADHVDHAARALGLAD